MKSHTAKTKVLLPHRLFGNIYVQELGRAYRELGCEIVYGPENFFESNYIPHIVHLNWPEEVARGFGAGTPDVRIRRFLSRLEQLRDDGAKLAWTVHNEQPHESPDMERDQAVYQRVIDDADIIHHHCACSLEGIARRYAVDSEKRQFVAQHGHFFSYKNSVNREEARRELGIEEDAFVYLHFGAIRGYKGIHHVIDGFKRIRKKKDVLLIAGRMGYSGGFGERARLAIQKRFSSSMHFHLRMIDSDDIQLYLNASNVVVLGHTAGLNSGVAILGMSFGRPVIGPRVGCIPSVLGSGNNLLYEPGDISGLAARMQEARDHDSVKVCEENMRAARRWKWSEIAQPVVAKLIDGAGHSNSRPSE